MRKLSFAILCTLYSLNCWSTPLYIETKNLSGDFSNNIGTMTADRIIIQTEDWTINEEFVEFPFEQNESGIFATIGTREVSLDLLGFVVKNVDQFNVENFSHKMTENHFSAIGDQLDLLLLDGSSYKAAGINLNCSISDTGGQVDALHQIISTCLNGNTTFQSESITIVSANTGGIRTKTKGLIQSLMLSLSQSIAKNADIFEQRTMTLDNLEATIEDNNYVLSMEARDHWNIGINSNGKMSYEREEGHIHVRIDRLKAGIFDLRNRIFNELEQRQSEKLRVERPNIYAVF